MGLTHRTAKFKDRFVTIKNTLPVAELIFHGLWLGEMGIAKNESGNSGKLAHTSRNY